MASKIYWYNTDILLTCTHLLFSVSWSDIRRLCWCKLSCVTRSEICRHKGILNATWSKVLKTYLTIKKPFSCKNNSSQSWVFLSLCKQKMEDSGFLWDCYCRLACDTAWVAVQDAALDWLHESKRKHVLDFSLLVWSCCMIDERLLDKKNHEILWSL